MAAFGKSAEYSAVLKEAKRCCDRFLAERDPLHWGGHCPKERYGEVVRSCPP